MRKGMTLFLAAAVLAGMTAAGFAAEYDRYDRYERGYREEPPPVRRAPEPPRVRHAHAGEPYIYGQIGLFQPNNSSEGLSGYDSGGNLSVAFGSRLHPLFAVEGAIGGFSASVGSSDAYVYPITIGGRFIVPNPFLEPYIGGGLGIYFSSLKDTYFEIDDDSADLGGYLSLGMDFWLNQRVALNFEGKYQWVDASFSDVYGRDRDIELGGWTVNFGVRVSF